MTDVAPRNLVERLEDLMVMLNCVHPSQSMVYSKDNVHDQVEYASRVGAWDTQQLIIKKLKHAVSVERENSKPNSYVWVSHEPYYEKDVLEILDKNERLMKQIDELRKSNKLMSNVLEDAGITDIRTRRIV